MSETERADPTKFLASLKGMSSALSNYSNQTKVSDSFGASIFPLDKEDLEIMADTLHDKFNVDWGSAPGKQVYFDDLAPKIEWATANLIPQIHAQPNAAAALVGLLYSVDLQVSALLTPELVDQMARIPIETRRAIRDAKTRFEHANATIGNLDEKVRAINDAHAAAKDWPTTLADLEAAAADIETSRNNALRHEADAKKQASDAAASRDQVKGVLDQANQTMARVNAAFRAATSEGLAREFKQKAFRLNLTLVAWAGVLVAALILAVDIGSRRFPAVLASVSITAPGGAPNWGVIAIQMLISILSLGAPIWLAWVATKQIGERFRLAEDYAYKAALSSAYEGYRTEATNLDPLLQAQLFSIALSRLDEIPLRLVDRHVSGSPLHELLRAAEFKEALEKTPGLRELVVRIFAPWMPKKAAAANDGAEAADTEATKG